MEKDKNQTEATVQYFGTIPVIPGSNPRELYDHQEEAMENLDIINQADSFSTILVLPTGAGKTFTAAVWLMKNALNRKKKILWIAHRHSLLDQALDTFKNHSYGEYLNNIESFKYRIISGSNKHDIMCKIELDDDILIVSKDSLRCNLQELDKWLKNEDEIFFVIDEAHHSTASTYRKIITYLKDRVRNLKTIGLTATPFRTSEKEKGQLSRIFTDGVENGKVIHGEKGIVYGISLRELIDQRKILADITEEIIPTGVDLRNEITEKDIDWIYRHDDLPENILKILVENKNRNRFIVEKYISGKKKYGKTIVFALNIPTAHALTALFTEHGVKAGCVVSNVISSGTGVKIDSEINQKNIEKFRNEDLEVLVNVNILTEGVDLPMTKTVFLTKPTVSKIRMTQMVGRALRGRNAGGTDEAYAVSFMDSGLDNVAWVNPSSIFDESEDFDDTKANFAGCKAKSFVHISKLAEYARILDESVDTSFIESIKFSERIPVGTYIFDMNTEYGTEYSYKMAVYNSTYDRYKELFENIDKM